MQYDHVDKLLVQWLQRTDLDCSPMGVIGRLNRMSKIIDKKIYKTFKINNLSSIEFDILAVLRRFNESMTPTELYQTLMLSSGVISTKIEKLVKRELIERIASIEDRRSCSLTLTEKGKALINNVFYETIKNKNKIIEPLSKEEQQHLASLLRAWLLANES